MTRSGSGTAQALAAFELKPFLQLSDGQLENHDYIRVITIEDIVGDNYDRLKDHEAQTWMADSDFVGLSGTRISIGRLG